VSWSGDASGPANPTTVVMDAVKSVTATFVVNPVVPPVANLVATQVRSGNAPGNTTGIVLTWDATAPGTTVEVWRAGFGQYPEYDDAGGALPAASPTYPPGGAWALTAVTTPGGTDLVGVRDFYYYVAYARDGFGTWSAVSSQTAGTLNYHLGDVSDGFTVGVGNNRVATEDVSLLGAHFGIVGAAVTAFAYLDVGPTTTTYIDGRPTTDNRIDFEDLVMFALNYGQTTGPMMSLAAGVAGAASADEMMLEVADRVAVGGTLTARLRLRGTGVLRAVSTTLAWDPAVVEPVGQEAGAWLTQQNGVAFASRPGTVDAAVLQSPGLTGDGVLATVTFKVRSAGDPKVRIAVVDGRDARNQKVVVGSVARPRVPAVTALGPAQPNPFQQTATLAFSLAKRGRVELALYSVDGRKVRTLVREVREPGEYREVWNGRDDNGNATSAGVYYARLMTAQGGFTRTVTYLK
jgi:hypothetical protein